MVKFSGQRFSGTQFTENMSKLSMRVNKIQPSLHVISFLVGALVTLGLYIVISSVTSVSSTGFKEQSIRSLSNFKQRGSCEFPIVYNKPPKTAGTYIQTLITDWTRKSGRANYLCGGKRAIETSVYLHECVSREDDGCGVFNAHLVLTPQATTILSQRLPNYRLLTSTRYPAHRIVSFYLQLNLYKTENMSDHDQVEKGLQEYLRHQYNPWAQYNFHTGGYRKKTSCPLRLPERIDIFNVASQYDLVVDANVPEISNIILRDHGLFQFPEDGDPVNVRGAGDMNLSAETLDLIRNVSCVEEELHRAFHMRMASLYEKATGKTCVESGRVEDLKTCLEEEERKNLKHTWLI